MTQTAAISRFFINNIARAGVIALGAAAFLAIAPRAHADPADLAPIQVLGSIVKQATTSTVDPTAGRTVGDQEAPGFAWSGHSGIEVASENLLNSAFAQAVGEGLRRDLKALR
jgi:hypothetical protein